MAEPRACTGDRVPPRLGQARDNTGHDPRFKRFSLLEGKIPVLQQSRAALVRPPDLTGLVGASFKLQLCGPALHPLES